MKSFKQKKKAKEKKTGNMLITFTIFLALLATIKADSCSATVGLHVHKKATETQLTTVTVIAAVKQSTTTNISSSVNLSSTSVVSSTAKDTASSSATETGSDSKNSATSSSSLSNSAPSGDLEDYKDPTVKFEDGTLSCDSFPSGQGVIEIGHLEFGGWTGIEYINSDGTVTTGGNCREGAYCSYACQPGMSKTQWPSDQPSNGISIGGLICKNNKLYRTNTNTDYLCEWGVDVAYVNNQVDSSVSICRTDYPGTENMVIPTVIDSAQKKPLTTVDESTYYKWEGMYTSAQYYVNNAGVDWQTGCTWGVENTGTGNWAPLVLGAGYMNGVAYLSMIPNPNNMDAANFNMEITAYDGTATISGSCIYENGHYNGQGTDGCTVGVTSGKVQYRIYS